MTVEMETLHVYLTNVWRLLFYSTRGPNGWSGIENDSFYNRISAMGTSINRDLDIDLDAAQKAVDEGQKFPDWARGVLDERASA
jgi:hypothetical protein